MSFWDNVKKFAQPYADDDYDDYDEDDDYLDDDFDEPAEAPAPRRSPRRSAPAPRPRANEIPSWTPPYESSMGSQSFSDSTSGVILRVSQQSVPIAALPSTPWKKLLFMPSISM